MAIDRILIFDILAVMELKVVWAGVIFAKWILRADCIVMEGDLATIIRRIQRSSTLFCMSFGVSSGRFPKYQTYLSEGNQVSCYIASYMAKHYEVVWFEWSMILVSLHDILFSDLDEYIHIK